MSTVTRERVAPGKLENISPSKISENPENPRLIFRPEEMDSLLVSIDQYGIQVPLTVYKEGKKYHLIDGERRWRCAKKLRFATVPAIVQEKPTELQNLVLMYNIHALREQWDYFTIASKLERIIELFEIDEGYYPNEREQAELTGLTVGAIRRCQLLINLPDRFKSMILEELEKPKSQQRLTEDFFIEMEKSLKSVLIRLPEYEEQIDDVRNALIEKYERGDITAITDFRQLSKIATAIENIGIARDSAKGVLDRVFNTENDFGIKEAYSQTVEFDYYERKAFRDLDHVSDFLETVINNRKYAELDDDTIEELRRLYNLIRAVLEAI